FQAEDGIRDKLVTGVQTCALPILRERRCWYSGARWQSPGAGLIRSRCGAPVHHLLLLAVPGSLLHHGLTGQDREYRADSSEKHRSEERRVGKECRSRRERSAKKGK